MDNDMLQSQEPVQAIFFANLYALLVIPNIPALMKSFHQSVSLTLVKILHSSCASVKGSLFKLMFIDVIK